MDCRYQRNICQNFHKFQKNYKLFTNCGWEGDALAPGTPVEGAAAGLGPAVAEGEADGLGPAVAEGAAAGLGGGSGGGSSGRPRGGGSGTIGYWREQNQTVVV